MYDSITLHDNYGILDPMLISMAFKNFAVLNGHCVPNLPMLHATSSLVTMKMLKIYVIATAANFVSLM